MRPSRRRSAVEQQANALDARGSSFTKRRLSDLNFNNSTASSKPTLYTRNGFQKEKELYSESDRRPNKKIKKNATPTSANATTGGFCKKLRSRDEEDQRNASRPNHDFCDACGDGGDLLCCDNCPSAFHFSCVDPPMDVYNIPNGDWYCQKCTYLLDESSRSNYVGAFASVFEACAKANPTVFRLPSPIRKPSYLEKDRDKECKNIDLIELLGYPDASIIRYSVDDKCDMSKKRKSKSCVSCGLEFKNSSYPILNCNYCKKNYHVYCVDFFPIEPQKNWICPDHETKPKVTQNNSDSAQYTTEELEEVENMVFTFKYDDHTLLNNLRLLTDYDSDTTILSATEEDGDSWTPDMEYRVDQHSSNVQTSSFNQAKNERLQVASDAAGSGIFAGHQIMNHMRAPQNDLLVSIADSNFFTGSPFYVLQHGAATFPVDEPHNGTDHSAVSHEQCGPLLQWNLTKVFMEQKLLQSQYTKLYEERSIKNAMEHSMSMLNTAKLSPPVMNISSFYPTLNFAQLSKQVLIDIAQGWFQTGSPLTNGGHVPKEWWDWFMDTQFSVELVQLLAWQRIEQLALHAHLQKSCPYESTGDADFVFDSRDAGKSSHFEKSKCTLPNSALFSNGTTLNRQNTSKTQLSPLDRSRI